MMKQYTANLEWIKQLFIGIEHQNDGLDTSKHVISDGFDKKNGIDNDKSILDLPEDIILLFFQYLSPKDLIR
jgi:hypothetical protein